MTAVGKIKLQNQSIESIKNSFIKGWLDRLYPIWKLVENARKRGVKMSAFDVYFANQCIRLNFWARS